MSTATQSINNEQIDYVFKQLKITGWPHALAVTLTAYSIWQYQPGVAIVAWFLVMQISHILRVHVLDPRWQSLKQQQQDYFPVRVLLTAGMFFTGCLWALIPLLFMADPQSETFLFVSIALAGMISATLPALAAFLPAYLGFVLPIFCALALRFFIVGMEAAALLTLCFLGAMCGISYIINQIITRSITIDFKNQLLLQEVTDAKEKAEQANQAKSRFLAAASHDLRQPLQAMGLLLESMRLRLGNDDTNLRPLVSRCVESHDALSALLNALLELSRLESHELDVRPVALPVRDLVGTIVAEFQPSAQLKGLSLEYAGGDYTVQTDPVLFGRILRNLISNAIKYTDTGGVSVTFVRDQQDVLLSVIDTGRGIPLDEQEKVFDEYHQVANDARNREEGIGLGLSVVKKMSQLLRHPITLTSEPGHGTTFSLRLPLGQMSTAPPAPAEATPTGLDGCRVVIIEDDSALLAAIATIMADWKCVCLTAPTLDEARRQVRSQNFEPDLILSDYRLGEGVTGIDAIVTLRADLQRDIPAVLMSGDTDPALVKSIRDQHYYLIHKPVKAMHLRKTMRMLLGR